MDNCPKCGKNLRLVGRMHKCEPRNVLDTSTPGVVTKEALEGLKADLAREPVIKPTLADAPDRFYRKPTKKRVAAVVAKVRAEEIAEAADMITTGLGALGKPFLLQVPADMEPRLEAERVKRGLRSRAGTIRALLEEALR